MHCRIFIPAPLQTGGTIALPSDQAHYLRHVMRLGAGDSITLFNGEGGEYLCTIDQLARDHSQVRIDSHSNIERELGCRIHIVQAACRSEKIEGVLQKCTELGAASFQIVRSERSDLKLDDKKRASRLERWQKIIIEAAEQSGRTRVPTVAWCPSLAEVSVTGLPFLLHPESAQAWPQCRESLSTAQEVTLAIGPEGGWSQMDLQRLQKLSFQPLLFGTRVMRTETAAPALTAAIAAIRND